MHVNVQLLSPIHLLLDLLYFLKLFCKWEIGKFKRTEHLFLLKNLNLVHLQGNIFDQIIISYNILSIHLDDELKEQMYDLTAHI